MNDSSSVSLGSVFLSGVGTVEMVYFRVHACLVLLACLDLLTVAPHLSWSFISPAGER